MDAAPADIAPVHVGHRRDFINFIYVDNAILGPFAVPVRAAQQLPHEILDIPAHIARLGKLGRVSLDKGHADQIGRIANQVGFADARRPD